MSPDDMFIAADGLFVVETTDGDAFLGQVVLKAGRVVVLSGFAGRPNVVAASDLAAVTPAAVPPDVTT